MKSVRALEQVFLLPGSGWKRSKPFVSVIDGQLGTRLHADRNEGSKKGAPTTPLHSVHDDVGSRVDGNDDDEAAYWGVDDRKLMALDHESKPILPPEGRR